VPGIWHGAGLNFLFWGIFYAILLILERWKLKSLLDNPKFHLLGHIYTLLSVMIGWVFFRADNMLIACKYIGKMFSFTNNVKLPVTDFLTPQLTILMILGILFATIMIS
jgi:alginate O-acetyltransferase complex protein AlgI